jgi:DNA polymerase-1
MSRRFLTKREKQSLAGQLRSEAQWPRESTVIFDIETTRIEDNYGVPILPNRVHCIVACDANLSFDENVKVFGPDAKSLNKGIEYLQSFKRLVAHNGQAFDIPVLKNVWALDMKGRWCIDTLILSRMIWSNLGQTSEFNDDDDDDNERVTKANLKKHSLEAWGERLGFPKMDYMGECKKLGIEDPWAEYSEIMRTYAIQDVGVLHKFWNDRLLGRLDRHVHECSKSNNQNLNFHHAIMIEHYAHDLMDDLRKSGIKYNKEKSANLLAELEVRAKELEDQIQAEYPPRLQPQKWVYREIKGNKLTELMSRENTKTNVIYRPYFKMPEGYEREMWGEEFEYKRPKQVDKGGYIETIEGPLVKVSYKPFNPGSRIQIARKLLEMGFEPEEFTDKGGPKIDEKALGKIEDEIPSALSILKFLTVKKRISQLAGGKQAWISKVSPQGFIHPTIAPCATVTFRAAHSSPNISQVPSVRSKDVLSPTADDPNRKISVPLRGEEGRWGWECRELFEVPYGFKMLGSDLSGIELRFWAHYLYPYDKGRLVDIILNEDVHEVNRRLLGFANRRDAKAFLFALIYGAGDTKLGKIISPLSSEEQQLQIGREARARFVKRVTGMEQLLSKIGRRVANTGYLQALDGRLVPVRSSHAALNTALQSAGAILSKYWMKEVIDRLDKEGLKWGYDRDYTLMIYSHDELQFAVKDKWVDLVRDACLDGAKLHIPIASEVKIGNNWAETH